MGIFDTLKGVIWCQNLAPEPTNDAVEETYLGTDQPGSGYLQGLDLASPGNTAEIATPAPIPMQSLALTEPDASAAEIDVAARLDAAAITRGENLNWRTSIIETRRFANGETDRNAET